MVLACLSVSVNFSASLFNFIPKVEGKVVEKASGKAIANANVKVVFMGARKLLTDDEEKKKAFVIKTLETTTNNHGEFQLQRTNINVLRGYFVGMQVSVKKDGFSTQHISAANMRAMGGVIGNFIIGLIDAQGEDFKTPIWDAFKHAVKVVRDSRVRVVYKKMFEEPFALRKPGEEDEESLVVEGQRQVFTQLYSDPAKVNLMSEVSVTAPIGTITIYQNASGQSQIKGTYNGAQFNSAGPSQIPFNGRNVGEQGGNKYVQFFSPKATIIVANNYPAVQLSAAEKQSLEAMAPGCISGGVVKTAVVMAKPSGMSVVAGFNQVVLLK